VIGRIDVHTHLLPGVDDGCKTVDESLACAQVLVAHGYTHAFCTPHIWPSFGNDVDSIPADVSRLQEPLDQQAINLRLIPGGEINLRPDYATTTSPQRVATYAMGGKFALIDMWHEKIPEYVGPSIRWLQSFGLTVILAHPERMRAIQEDDSVHPVLFRLRRAIPGQPSMFRRHGKRRYAQNGRANAARGSLFSAGLRSPWHGKTVAAHGRIGANQEARWR
jgi:protein-tyrosine phosphatase